MSKKFFAVLLSGMLLTTSVAQADDDALWALGGFLLGRITAERNQPPAQSPPPAPPRRHYREVPIYRDVCEWQYTTDIYGNPVSRTWVCHRELVGWREVYD